MLVKPLAQFFVDELLDVALDVAVQLAFGLSLKLRLRQADRDDRYEAFANVVAGDGHFIFLLFQHAGGGGEIVDGASESRAKTRKVRAAVHGVNRVCEREDIFAVGIVVLQRDFDFDVAAFPFDVDRRIVERGLAAIEVLDEFGDTAGKAKLGGLFRAFVGQA